MAPPRSNAVKWEMEHPRNDVLDEIDNKGVAMWKSGSGYHLRSLPENAMYRLKKIFGDKLVFESQVMEIHVRIAVMNVMTYFGVPKSVAVDSFDKYHIIKLINEATDQAHKEESRYTNSQILSADL